MNTNMRAFSARAIEFVPSSAAFTKFTWRLNDTLPGNLDAASQAIWTKASSSSLTSESTGKSSAEELSLSLGNVRKLVGRGAEYYKFYGTVHVVPHGFLDHLPPQYNHGKANPSVKGTTNPKECSFCKNLDRPKDHSLRNWQTGKVTCPVLRAYKCPLCNNTDPDNGHTKRFCPNKRSRSAQEHPNAYIQAGNNMRMAFTSRFN